MFKKGFTLIELMIVVAIIGILSMFALPAYQDYTKRTYVSEGMALSTAAKMASTEYFSSEGQWPLTNSQAGIANASAITGQAVAGIQIKTGGSAATASPPVAAVPDVTNIIVHYNQKVTGNAADNTYRAANTAGTVTIAPVNTVDAGSVEWRCTQINGTSGSGTLTSGVLQGKWLPANCRNQIPQ